MLRLQLREQLTMLRLQTIPTTDGALRGGGCDPFFVVKCMRERGGAWQTVKVHDQIKSGAKIRKLHPPAFPSDRT